WSEKLLQRMRRVPGISDPNSDQQNKGNESRLVIDRDTATRLNLSPQAIDEALYDAFGQRNVSTMYQAINQYFVVMEVDPRFQQDPSALRAVYVRSSTGNMVPLSAVAHYELNNTTLAVNHQSQSPAVTIS